MRGFGEQGRPSAGGRARLIDAIAGIRRDQAAVQARIGTAFVDIALLERAVRDQQKLLDEAVRQIRGAEATARHAADSAAAESGEAAAAPYRQAAEAFGAQLPAVESVSAQLHRLGAGAAGNLDLTRRLLRESAASLDAALRAEVELLGRLERLDRRNRTRRR